MGLATADDIALIALIVSLTALVIALVQLLQSSALTADGWRECSSAIIGEWSMFRTWNWHWSEMRYEVLFAAPEIKLVTASQLEFSTQSDKRLIETSKPKGRQDEEKGDSLTHKRTKKRFDRADTFRDVCDPTTNLQDTKRNGFNWKALHVLGFGTLPMGIESDSDAPRTTGMRGYKAWLNRFRNRGKNDRIGSSEELVSWGSLILHLHQFQAENVAPIDSHPEGLETLKIEKDQIFKGKKKRDDHELTFVALRLHQHSWDLMPPDVVRPPAMTSLGDILLLAQRLGLSWTTCNPAVQQYVADDSHRQGFSIQSTLVRGLGTVFRFEALFQDLDLRRRQRLCSVDADKMLFGIIPGCAALGLKDTPLVGRDGKIDEDAIMEELGMYSERFKKIMEKSNLKYKTIHNDLIAFLAPFMPLDDCPFLRVRHPMPARGLWLKSRYTFFDRPETRCTLLWKFNKADFDGKTKVQSLFDKLRSPEVAGRGTPKDTTFRMFYASHRDSRLLDKKEKENRLIATKILRGVHTETTNFFRDLATEITPTEQQEDPELDQDDTHDQSDRIARLCQHLYMELVRGHSGLVAQCLLDWYHDKEEEDNQKKDSKSDKDVKGEKSDKDGKGGKSRKSDKSSTSHTTRRDHEVPTEQELVDLGCERLSFRTPLDRIAICARFPEDESLNIVIRRMHKSFDEKSLPADKIKLAWWMLLVRGMAWRMSVEMEVPDIQTLVPSWLYNNRSRVWIA